MPSPSRPLACVTLPLRLMMPVSPCQRKVRHLRFQGHRWLALVFPAKTNGRAPVFAREVLGKVGGLVKAKTLGNQIDRPVGIS